MKALSLFSNIGVAEAYLHEVGVDVVIANELVKRRADLYKKIYPKTDMICGDITNPLIVNEIVQKSLYNKIDVIMATPPCQGMSTAGRQDSNDKRNSLILPVIDIIERINPKYVFIENVPLFLNTAILYKNKKILIPELIHQKLGHLYTIVEQIIDTKNYSVPQTRERTIILMTRKDLRRKWTVPEKDQKIVTMYDAIGNLPSIDPFIKDVSYEELISIFPHYEEKKKKALSISKWNIPPVHIKRQVEAMIYTPTGKSAFDNVTYYPKKSNGQPVKGYRNTYKRQNWDTAAYTITMDNRKISSQNNVHPGRLLGVDQNGNNIYSDPRALTLYELMLIMSIPKDWPIPKQTSEAFLRSVIGEGIPPLFVKKVFEKIS